jgi:hypothetical protein
VITNCLKCGSTNWSPAQGCGDCGYNPTFMALSPSSVQQSKFLKHGITIVSSGIYYPQTVWNPYADPNVSHFASSLDLVLSIQWVASSGSLVVPAPGRHGGKVSLISYCGFTTGEGVFGGSHKYFQGVRLVNVNDSTLVHMYPDQIRPGAILPLSVGAVSSSTQRPMFPYIAGVVGGFTIERARTTGEGVFYNLVLISSLTKRGCGRALIS